MITMHMYNSHS